MPHRKRRPKQEQKVVETPKEPWKMPRLLHIFLTGLGTVMIVGLVATIWCYPHYWLKHHGHPQVAVVWVVTPIVALLIMAVGAMVEDCT